MAKMTVLEMVKDILNDTDSDPVTSISETEESIQCEAILKSSYFELMSSKEWPHLNTVTQLIASVATHPSMLKIPDLVSYMKVVNYDVQTVTDTKTKFKEIDYEDPMDFLQRLNNRDSSSSTITVVTGYDDTDFNIYNDRAPSKWTSFDDINVMFDAYDSDVESALAVSKTQIIAQKSAIWSDLDGGFIPLLPENAFPALLAEAKSSAFVVLQQTENSKAEQKAKRTSARLSRKGYRVRKAPERPDYGKR